LEFVHFYFKIGVIVALIVEGLYFFEPTHK